MVSPYILRDAVLDDFLQNDAPWGDATSWGLGISELAGRMEFRARHAQVACCTEEALRMGALCGLRPGGPWQASGTRVEAGGMLLSLEGRAADLHRVWKPAQTLMEYAAGIASATAELLSAGRAGNPDVALACTRKHLPGTKDWAIKAILCGGGTPHRLSISDTLLIFAEHRSFLGDIPPAEAISRLKRTWPERKVVVEVADEEEAAHWMQAGADVIQLEKCPPDIVERVVARAAQCLHAPLVAAAGGVNSANASAYARAGAHLLVSSAPYSAAPNDVSVHIEIGPGRSSVCR